MASAVARAYNGGLGAVPPAGPRGRAPGQCVWGRSPPEAEHNLTLLGALVVSRHLRRPNLDFLDR